LLVMDELNAEQATIHAKAEVHSPPNSPRVAAAAAAGAISFCVVDIVTPDGQCIAQNVDFQVFADGESNLAITGGNAVGKSSLFRVLGGLWPQQRGRIELPPRMEAGKSGGGGLALVPQQPLIPTVPISLAEMITYPHSSDETGRSDGTETELCSLLKLVGLEYLSEREGLWDNARPWGELLSLGEQQALGIARLLYAKPQYAVLDECLSAVSTEVQAAVYKALSDRKIATVAIMHEVSEVATPYFSQELKLGQAVPAGWSHESRASNSESVLDGPDAVDEELKLESADEEDKDDNPPPPASP
jgi:ATP-binding cassette subfamily D (ALD) long-chain fatty acid import protein